MNDKAPQYLCDNFEQRNRIHNRATRRNGDLDIPKYIGHRSVKDRSNTEGLSLDTELKSINLRQFLLRSDVLLFNFFNS
jgi:hypothetical protein